LDKRTVIGFVLIMMLMILWVMHTERQRRLAEESQSRAVREQPSVIEDATPPEKVERPATEPSRIEPAPVVDQAPLRSLETVGPDELQKVDWTNEGAAITRVRLTKFKKVLDKPEMLTVIEQPEDRTDLPETLTVFDARDPEVRLPFHRARYEVEKTGDGSGVTFSALLPFGGGAAAEEGGAETEMVPGGIRVRQEGRAAEDPYMYDVTLTFENTSSRVIKNFQYRIVAGSRVIPEVESRYPVVTGFCAVERRGSNDYKHVNASSAVKEAVNRQVASDEVMISAGVANRYFAVALLPQPEQGRPSWVREATVRGVDAVDVKPDKEKRTPNVYVTFLTRPGDLEPGKPWVHHYRLFAGPKDPELIARYPALDGIIDYGLFGAVSKVLEAILRFFYNNLAHNYGLAIIMLTLFVRLCLLPLTWKSQVSMRKMQKLQPFLNELREKLKNDKQRLAQEQMKLMRQHNVNPLMGCLPIFLQLPVFIGLFRMIQNAVTMRHESFILWIQDLSGPDTITRIGSFPVNILPVVMTLVWFLQNQMMPKSQDPQQRATQRMMKFMPIMFGFILYNMAAGLTLYWTTSAILGIIEQRFVKAYIDKHHSDEIPRPAILNGGSGSGGRKKEKAGPDSKEKSPPRPGAKRPPKRQRRRR